MSRIKFIHYGSDKFDPKLLENSGDQKESPDRFVVNKPFGLWGSPLYSQLSWRNFCEQEDYKTETLNKSFLFKLKEGARVLCVKRPSDLGKYACFNEKYGKHVLNLSRIYEDFDAMLVYMDNWSEMHYSDIFYAWDVDSVVVWNPDVVVPV